MKNILLSLLVLLLSMGWKMTMLCMSFSFPGSENAKIHPHSSRSSQSLTTVLRQSSTSSDLFYDEKWKGDGAQNEGTIRGCLITPVGGGNSSCSSSSTTTTLVTEWIISIDGVEADLGRFSESIYKQIMNSAKQERFQGFRPGTIPPHLLPTYKAYCMDECARETVLEAMQQNNIQPFADARSQFVIEQVSIPPVGTKKKKKLSMDKKNKNGGALVKQVDLMEEPEPHWRFFETMDGAIKAGWKPGQSFTFVAKNVKGQRVLTERTSMI